ncbi:coiled-coil domain-containing protein 40 isoform X2 [Atheta coriaria]|uniref:coiled-coil domain-containing protein 40 isoform X2 n=1 Tax=Dalotia coriaria TaxID=877792 RepID=UPI0031F4690C
MEDTSDSEKMEAEETPKRRVSVNSKQVAFITPITSSITQNDTIAGPSPSSRSSSPTPPAPEPSPQSEVVSEQPVVELFKAPPKPEKPKPVKPPVKMDPPPEPAPSVSEELPVLQQVGSDFFNDFQLKPLPEKHFNLTPDLEHPVAGYQPNELGYNLKPSDVDLSQLLAADHPLLDRFQKSLKEQLMKKIYSMQEEVADLIEGCKTKRVEKETLGTEAFETQKTATKLGHNIRVTLKDLETVTAAREELDMVYAKTLEDFDFEKTDNMAAEHDEINLRVELEAVDMLLKQMRDWEAELENELMINQRVMDFTTKTKSELYKEQKQLDVLVYNLMKDVWRLETEVEKVQMQIRVKEEDRERLAEAVALSNIDIESNQTEYRCLVHGWQSVLLTISQRDKYYNGLQAEHTKLNDALSGVNCELIHIRKEIQREHIENERLTLIKDRLDYEMKNITKSLLIETDKRDEYLRIVAQYDKYIEENKKQQEILKAEIEQIKEEETGLARELEALNQTKYQMEQDIIIHLQSNAFNSDACRQMANVLKDFKEENRHMRINIARVEGQISNTHAEYQYLRMENDEVSEQLRDLKMTMAAEDKELLNINRDFEKSEKLLVKNILLYEQLKLKASGDAAQKIELWPEEVRIRQLEASNAELMEKNKASQSFWLREQAIVVELSEKRHAQMKEMDLLKKQICVMDQKNLHINDTLENLRTLEQTLRRNINGYENRLNAHTSGLHKKRNDKTALNAANQKIQGELQMKLEDSEFEALRMKAEIIEIEEEKYSLSRELIDKNREVLCWEKKVLMVLDTRKQMHESHGESGELAQMRTEIHRMHVSKVLTTEESAR